MDDSRRHEYGPPAVAQEKLAWLARFAADAHNASTPLGAFLAAMPVVPRRKAKSSAERGRLFRQRQRQLEDRLAECVHNLDEEVKTLELTRSVWQSRCLQSRTSASGSLVRIVLEYHDLFSHGLKTIPVTPRLQVGTKRTLSYHSDLASHIQLQEEFLRRVIDPTACVGSQVGPEASIQQWRRYTQCHPNLSFHVDNVSVASWDDDLGTTTVRVACRFHARLSLATFEMMFPHVLGDMALVQRCLGRRVTYSTLKHYTFTSDGLIAMEVVDVDFVGGLSQAGISLDDVARLMDHAAVTKDSMIVSTSGEEEITSVTMTPLVGEFESKQSTTADTYTEGKHVDQVSAVQTDPCRITCKEASKGTQAKLSMEFILGA